MASSTANVAARTANLIRFISLVTTAILALCAYNLFHSFLDGKREQALAMAATGTPAATPVDAEAAATPSWSRMLPSGWSRCRPPAPHVRFWGFSSA